MEMMLKVFRILTLFLMLFILSCEKSNTRSLEVGSSAPDFVLFSIDEKKFTLSDYKGKVVLLEFWATWCPSCRMAIPEIEALYERFTGRDFIVLSINIDDENAKEKVKNFLNEYNVSYPVLLDNGHVTRMYAVRGVPTIFVLDRQQRIAKKYLGYSPGLGELLAQEIESLL